MDDTGKYLIFIYLIIPAFNFYQLKKLNIKISENLKSSSLVLLSLFAGVPLLSIVLEMFFSWIFKLPFETYLIISSIVFIFFYFHRFKSRTVKMGKIVYKRNKYKNLFLEIFVIAITAFTLWIAYAMITNSYPIFMGENLSTTSLDEEAATGIRAGILIFIYNVIIFIFGKFANEILGIIIFIIGALIIATIIKLGSTEGVKYFRRTYFNDKKNE